MMMMMMMMMMIMIMMMKLRVDACSESDYRTEASGWNSAVITKDERPTTVMTYPNGSVFAWLRLAGRNGCPVSNLG